MTKDDISELSDRMTEKQWAIFDKITQDPDFIDSIGYAFMELILNGKTDFLFRAEVIEIIGETKKVKKIVDRGSLL